LKSDYIHEKVLETQKKYDNAEPEKLAKAMGIIVSYEPMGNTSKSCKGFFVVFSRKKHITINSSLNEDLRAIVLMHEIAHAILHCSYAHTIFSDFDFLNNSDIKEYEANLFAADYIINDSEAIDILKEGMSFFEAASVLRVPPQLLDFKLRLMKHRGLNISEPPITSYGDFMKKINIPNI